MKQQLTPTITYCESLLTSSRPQGAGLSDFLGSLKRISDALSRLQSTNLRSNQDAISDFSRLLKAGSHQLENVFQEVLKEDARPVEPLFYITKRTFLVTQFRCAQSSRSMLIRLQRNHFPRSHKTSTRAWASSTPLWPLRHRVMALLAHNLPRPHKSTPIRGDRT